MFPIRKYLLLVAFLVVSGHHWSSDAELITDEAEAIAFLDYFNREVQERNAKMMSLNWNFDTNITDYNQQKQLEYKLQYTAFWDHIGTIVSRFNISAFTGDIQRQLLNLKYVGSAALKGIENLPILLEYNKLKADARKRFSTGKVCVNNLYKPDEDVCLSLDPDLVDIMYSNRNYYGLYQAWKRWRDAVGAPAKQDYARKAEILNQIAKENGFDDLGAVWRANYEVENFVEQAENLYNKLRPLYENLHAYTRRKLYEIYGHAYINLKGPIPAHLLADMWSQNWGGLFDILQPYPGKLAIDVSDEMKRKNFTAIKMFRVAEEFFTSLGLLPMPQSFWNNSMFEKPEDREVVCHASAWDFGNTKDFRIKMCTDISLDEFITVHHEMGHTQYQLQYRHLPYALRGGANPGFHEAIGDTLALSVSTPRHLHAVGLLEEVIEDDEADLNFLMLMALEKIAFLPYGYLLDQWRWGVFNGSITPDQYNTKWWQLRKRYQGIVPPLKRTEDDFDPAAKFHVAYDIPYIRYFVSFVLQFQFHQALCKEANATGPLHRCDIYNSKESGRLLASMLRMGSTKPWPDAMEIMTGQREMDAGPLLEYFKPLTDWLIKKNKINGDVIGWPDSQWMPPDPFGAATQLTAWIPTLHLCTLVMIVLKP